MSGARHEIGRRIKDPAKLDQMVLDFLERAVTPRRAREVKAAIPRVRPASVESAVRRLVLAGTLSREKTPTYPGSPRAIFAYTLVPEDQRPVRTKKTTGPKPKGPRSMPAATDPGREGRAIRSNMGAYAFMRVTVNRSHDFLHHGNNTDLAGDIRRSRGIYHLHTE
jgi:hypothetical protein